MGSVLLDTVDGTRICERAVRSMVDDLGAVNSSIMLLTPDRGALRLAAAYGRGDPDLSEAERADRFNRARTIALGEGVQVWGQILEDRGYVTGRCMHDFRTVQFRGRVTFLEDGDAKQRALYLMIDQLEADPETAKRGKAE